MTPAPRTPATVRSEWAMPSIPIGYVPAVHHTGDGWWAHFYRDSDGECIDIGGDAGWPFVEKVAYASDWERLGFEVVP